MREDNVPLKQSWRDFCVTVVSLFLVLFDSTWLVASTSTIRGNMIVRPEPNPPIWPENVLFFQPEDDRDEILRRIRKTQDDSYMYQDLYHPTIQSLGYNSNRHFTSERYALLFTPGVYEGLDFEIGYYVQLSGLGSRADDVVFTDCARGPFVEALNKREHVGGHAGLSLDTFWRMAENFKTEATNGQLWAVSQAAPMRRVHIATDLLLHDAGAWASGGVVANAIIEGKVEFGSQQQFLCRNVHFQGPVLLGAWSNVFVACQNHPKPSNGNKLWGGPSVTIDSSPLLTVEKPFLSLKDNFQQKYELRIPKPRMKTQDGGAYDESSSNIGPTLDGTNEERRDFAFVKVAIANKDSHEDLQTALDDGKDLLLSPGIYNFTKSLIIKKSNQVILGMGLATIVAPLDGTPCIKVQSHLEGVHIAGIMLEASELTQRPSNYKIASLLEWGDQGIQDPGNRQNPGTLHDIFVRVGGSTFNRNVTTDIMVRLHSGNIYGDNIWLWRADHVQLKEGENANFPDISKHYYQTVYGDCMVATGLEVTGDDVTIHGLAVEHTNEHQVIWKGNRGNVQFYQSEFPYDANCNFVDFHGYHVHDDVTHHTAGGVGIYSNFRDHFVPVEMAIYHPTNQENNKNIVFTDAFTKLLDNNGQINSIINGLGKAADDQKDPPSRMSENHNL